MNGTARASFEKCERDALQNEISRDLTLKTLFRARELFATLSDERLGRIFRDLGSNTIPSVSNNQDYAFKVGEHDYNSRSYIFNSFLSDLYSANAGLLQELRSVELGIISKAGKKSENNKAFEEATMRLSMIDDKKIFSCRKEDLGKAIVNFALQMNKWKTDRTGEQQKFIAALHSHLLEIIRNCEKIIVSQAQERRESLSVFLFYIGL